MNLTNDNWLEEWKNLADEFDSLRKKHLEVKITENSLRLAGHLEGFANSLRNGWMDEKSVYGSMLILLTSADYLKEKKKYYVREKE